MHNARIIDEQIEVELTAWRRGNKLEYRRKLSERGRSHPENHRGGLSYDIKFK